MATALFHPDLQSVALIVIDKPGYGAFYNTALEMGLCARHIDQLVLCGVTTEVCVHSTLCEAVDRGYACTVVSDATAASDPALQEPALAMVGVEGGIFGNVRSTADLLALWNTPTASQATP